MTDLRFQLFGFPVSVQPTFLLLLGVYALFNLQADRPLWQIAGFSVIAFVSVIAHELGHAGVARAFGLKTGEITLHGFGGEVAHEATVPSRSLVISLAGPLAGFTLAALAFGLSPMAQNEVAAWAMYTTGSLNLFWSAFNLLPMRPLDGGNALFAGLALLIRPATAYRATHALGLASAAGVVILGLSWDAVFLVLFGAMIGHANWRALQVAPRAG